MKITIPKPCHENWDMMTPEEKGRFCSVCSTTVRDFTLASDQEIIEVLSHSSKDICGNFYESQLNRHLHYSYINSVFMKFAVGFILTVGGLVSVQAQQNKPHDTLQTEEIKDIVIHRVYGHKNEKKILGSTTVIPGNLLANTPKNEVQTQLIGKGVTSIQKENTANRTMMRGGMSSVYRSNGEPVYVLDGKVVDHTTFVNLDQNLIKDVKVLNAVQASKFFDGKAQNGIIFIKTKKKSKDRNIKR
ncbi:hypothetical protein N6B72_20015 [Chryseobacterium soli]|uniref:hypothetical protein n=1 Tax=Chryseobacterium soli TaxID=445961 RepID=UPI002954E149|nr:hypothetical protein [Chryseobacterium soli]MDV7699212.1 hypothetical protein [Chryseobacterium soli]